MRLRLTHSLLAMVDGRSDLLQVAGRLKGGITDVIEKSISQFPFLILNRFNSAYTLKSEPIDYISDPTLIVPDEFRFEISVEHLNRIARERLIRLLPSFARDLEFEGANITELRLGNEGPHLDANGRMELERATLELRSLPIEGKVFVLADDIGGISRGAAEDGIREHGGILGERLSDPDYYVTNNEELAEEAQRKGAKRVLNLVELSVMRDR